MDHIINVLEHPYLVMNRIAETAYQESGEAVYQRLRDRVKRRHRFTVEDYKALKKSFIAFSRELDRLASKMEKSLSSQKKKPKDWHSLMNHTWIKRKKVLLTVGESFDLGYNKIYDRMRGRSAEVNNSLIKAIITEYQKMATWIRDEVEQAEAEKMNYRFSEGRGGGSHLPDKAKNDKQ